MRKLSERHMSPTDGYMFRIKNSSDKSKSCSHTITGEEKRLANAAAWAWHQRSSGGNTIPRWEAARSIVYRPSRFRYEALKEIDSQENTDAVMAAEKSPSSLLDGYELASVARHLDQGISASPLAASVNASSPNLQRRCCKKSQSRRRTVFCFSSKVVEAKNQCQHTKTQPTECRAHDHFQLRRPTTPVLGSRLIKALHLQQVFPIHNSTAQES
ncbi:hypothetical protein O6H91_15G036700 [Diphasiastrum complanatum]|uniref:Uncharacterized protein n=1 Tax=Diphasiastrum complanatum TaxID=34168 RepID=A0ACC2BHI5_DIPCM|nr:hypothetical protein O6H91_15G036700 [Diphasiastrum complanatum]